MLARAATGRKALCRSGTRGDAQCSSRNPHQCGGICELHGSHSSWSCMGGRRFASGASRAASAKMRPAVPSCTVPCMLARGVPQAARGQAQQAQQCGHRLNLGSAGHQSRFLQQSQRLASAFESNRARQLTPSPLKGCTNLSRRWLKRGALHLQLSHCKRLQEMHAVLALLAALRCCTAINIAPRLCQFL